MRSRPERFQSEPSRVWPSRYYWLLLTSAPHKSISTFSSLLKRDEIWLLPAHLDGFQKIHYSMVVDQLNVTFTALSDGTRRAMIHRLSRGPATVHELSEPFDLSQQMISKHIAFLVRARFVVKEKRGRESVCALRPESLKTVSDWALRYRQLWEERFDRLDAVVHRMKEAEAKHGRKNRR